MTVHFGRSFFLPPPTQLSDNLNITQDSPRHNVLPMHAGENGNFLSTNPHTFSERLKRLLTHPTPKMDLYPIQPPPIDPTPFLGVLRQTPLSRWALSASSRQCPPRSVEKVEKTFIHISCSSCSAPVCTVVCSLNPYNVRN